MRMIYSIGVLLLGLCSGLPGATADLMTVDDLPAELSSGAPGMKIAYGDDPLQFGELHIPAGDGPFPVVVFIHGGWRLAKYDINGVMAPESGHFEVINPNSTTWPLVLEALRSYLQ